LILTVQVFVSKCAILSPEKKAAGNFWNKKNLKEIGLLIKALNCLKFGFISAELSLNIIDKP
jgi:hypothetical protein